MHQVTARTLPADAELRLDRRGQTEARSSATDDAAGHVQQLKTVRSVSMALATHPQRLSTRPRIVADTTQPRQRPVLSILQHPGTTMIRSEVVAGRSAKPRRCCDAHLLAVKRRPDVLADELDHLERLRWRRRGRRRALGDRLLGHRRSIARQSQTSASPTFSTKPGAHHTIRPCSLDLDRAAHTSRRVPTRCGSRSCRVVAAARSQADRSDPLPQWTEAQTSRPPAQRSRSQQTHCRARIAVAALPAVRPPPTWTR